MGRIELIASESESRRFACRVFRAAESEVRERDVLESLLADQVDVLILRVPASAQSGIARLSRIGFPYFVADTLVYYAIDFSNWTPGPLKNTGLCFELLDWKNFARFEPMLDQIFSDYRNHYSANPYLPQDSQIAGYKEWVSGFCTGESPTKIGWLAYEGQTPVAFCTCTESSEVTEGVLYGVSPSHAGKGIYRDLVRFTGAHAKRSGKKAFKVSTQIQNLAVQKVWASEGFRMDRALLTVHLTPFLKASKIPAEVVPFSVSSEQLTRFAEITGDDNPIHLDESSAKLAGFDGPIAYGVSFNAFSSKYYGARFPGAGVLAVNQALSFQRPIYPDQEYSVRFSFPWIDSASGMHLAAAHVFDSQSRLSIASYSMLKVGAKNA